VHNYDVVVEASTFSGNEANVYGGGLWFEAENLESGGLSVVNSTFSGNTANYGGGLAVSTGGFAEIVHSTITANTANDGGGGIYVMLYDENAEVVLDHTIVSGNTAPGDTDDIGGYSEAAGAVTLSNSLVGVAADPALVTDGGNNEVGVDALLGPLQDNGGPTQTHLPLEGSPAIDTGDPAFAGPPDTDQRGLPRVQGTAVEKGAVELQVQVPETTTTTAPPAGPPPVVAEPTFTG
jgi:hypothetical protein